MFSYITPDTQYQQKLMIISFRSGYNVHTTQVDIIQYMEMIQVIKITLEHDLLLETQENYMLERVILDF